MLRVTLTLKNHFILYLLNRKSNFLDFGGLLLDAFINTAQSITCKECDNLWHFVGFCDNAVTRLWHVCWCWFWCWCWCWSRATGVRPLTGLPPHSAWLGLTGLDAGLGYNHDRWRQRDISWYILLPQCVLPQCVLPQGVMSNRYTASLMRFLKKIRERYWLPPHSVL